MINYPDTGASQKTVMCCLQIGLYTMYSIQFHTCKYIAPVHWSSSKRHNVFSVKRSLCVYIVYTFNKKRSDVNRQNLGKDCRNL